MRDDDIVRLRHMIEGAEAIGTFIEGRHRDDLESDRMLLFAVVRAIEIIGEAAGQVSEELREAEAAIPWRSIISMRNRLIHGYFDIDPGVVWTTASEEIPELLERLHALLGQMVLAERVMREDRDVLGKFGK